jgi:hypothetical protein
MFGLTTARGAPMKKWIQVLAVILPALTAGASHASLVGRDLDGVAATYEAYYDADLNISWLADANYGGGRMLWAAAQSWAADLSISGITGWRLPKAIFPDIGCSRQFDASTSGEADGFGCTKSEMAHLYSVESISTSSPGPFSNIQSGGNDGVYWAETLISADIGGGGAWAFRFTNGHQTGDNFFGMNFAWAVHDGDVGALVQVDPPSSVPEPSSLALVLAGGWAILRSRRRGTSHSAS